VKAEQYQERKEQLAGWPVKIVSYKLGTTYYVSIHNEEPGAWIVKGEGATLAEAEATPRKQAAEALAKIKKDTPPNGCIAIPGF